MTWQREDLQEKRSFISLSGFCLRGVEGRLIASQQGGWEQMYKMCVLAWARELCVWDVNVQGLCERVQGKHARCICLQDTSECECTMVVGAAVGRVTSSRARVQGWDRGRGEAKLPPWCRKSPFLRQCCCLCFLLHLPQLLTAVFHLVLHSWTPRSHLFKDAQWWIICKLSTLLEYDHRY